MSARIQNVAPIGTLFKQPRPRKRPVDMGRDTRERDPEHLALVRMLPCLVPRCGATRCEAAHVRMPSAAHGKRATGMQERPSDRWALPLCRGHHVEQHREGELTFYYRLNVSPVQLCVELYAASPDLDRMRAVIFEARR